MSHAAEHPGNHADGLREAFFRHTHAMLQAGHDDPNSWKSLRDCLEQWGFDLRLADLLPIGFFSDAQSLRHKLRQDGFTADEIRASSLLEDSRLQGRLVGPIRDAHGRILSFWARQAQYDGARCLYLTRQWKLDTAVFGLDVAMDAVAGGKQDLVLVEDVLDALLLHSRGLRHVAALGTSPAEMTQERWQRLAELGVYRTTLTLDTVRSSPGAALQAIVNAARATLAPAVYLLPPEALAGARGPWELVRAMGPDVLTAVLAAGRMHGFRYIALAIAAKHKQARPWTDASQQAALEEAMQFYTSVHQRNVPQLDAFFLPVILQELGLSRSTLACERGSVWVEDAPSGNGQHLGDPHVAPIGIAGPEAAASPVDEPAVVAPSVAVPEPVEPEGVVSESAASSLSVPEDFCEFHQCNRKACLCWD